jgi:hypothetical protein
MRAVIAIFAALLNSAAIAGPKCTDAPVDRWISAADMKAKIAAADYKIDVFKITNGNCYEIYGRNKEGKRVEIYFDPTSGETVRESTRH